MLLWERRPRFADIAAAIVVLLTFLLPAQHVVTSFVIPIRSVFHEVEVLRSPPDEVNPHAHIKVATAALRQGDLVKALHFVDNAIKLDGAPFATMESSLDSADLWLVGQVTGAFLAADPNAPQALLLRSQLFNRAGNRAAAIADLEHALQFAPPDWSQRPEAQRELARLQRGG
jgi:tetratricopeptide (TPR) repeat protein